MVRPEIKELSSLGSFPPSQSVKTETIDKQEELLRNILPPVTDEEARELIKLFGPDDYFGGAWTVLHLIESAPNWPLSDCLTDESSEWIRRLKERVKRVEDRSFGDGH